MLFPIPLDFFYVSGFFFTSPFQQIVIEVDLRIFAVMDVLFVVLQWEMEKGNASSILPFSFLPGALRTEAHLFAVSLLIL